MSQEKIVERGQKRLEDINNEFKEISQQQIAVEEQLQQIKDKKQQLIGEFSGIQELISDTNGEAPTAVLEAIQEEDNKAAKKDK